MLDPAAVLLDEPLGNLDVAKKDELLALFAELFRRKRVPVVYVTHDPREVAHLATRVAVLETGRIVQLGTRRTRKRAGNRFRAELRGIATRTARVVSVPMVHVRHVRVVVDERGVPMQVAVWLTGGVAFRAMRVPVMLVPCARAQISDRVRGLR